MENKDLKEAEISRQSQENVKGGAGHPNACPRCGNMEWNLILNPNTSGILGYECARCGFFVDEAGEWRPEIEH